VRICGRKLVAQNQLIGGEVIGCPQLENVECNKLRRVHARKHGCQ